MRVTRNLTGFSRLSTLAIATLFFWNGVATCQAAELMNKPAPRLVTTDLQQHPVNLAELHGQTVLVMFWATWCGPCRKEMPEVQAVYEKYRNAGFAVIAVNVGEDREDVEKYVKKMDVRLPIVLDSEGKIAERFGVIGLPTNYIVDGEGNIRDRILGGKLTADYLESIVVKSGE